MIRKIKLLMLILLCLVSSTIYAHEIRRTHECSSFSPSHPVRVQKKTEINPAVNRLFQRAIRAHAFPGGCVIAGTKNRIIVQQCFGNHSYGVDYPDRLDDVFDLASLTKTVGTTTAILQLQEQHRLKPSDRVVQYLPEFTGPNKLNRRLKATITIEDLLRHRSGLPDSNPVHRMTNVSLSERWTCLYRTPLKYYPRQKEIYSDLNFLLLGKIVERITHNSLDAYLNTHVFKPLKMDHTSFHPQENNCKIVPTYSPDQVGIVHDPVARSLGGVCGHAGLFSTAIDLQHFAQMILNNGEYQGSTILQKKSIQLLTQRDEVLKDSTRYLGWDSAYRPDSSKVHRQFSAGHYCDADAMGHTGYTGTSLWISRKQGVYVILLTNRVFGNANPGQHAKDRYWRQEITSTVWKSLGFRVKNDLYQEPRRH